MEDQIKRRAYELWEAEGRPQGQDQAFWFKAINELASVAATIKAPRKRAVKPRKAA